jgi:hypothetical protein
MALNITFTCNEVTNEDGDSINCKYQVYYPDYGVWNDVRDTELYQYNCNAGDGDSLTQTGTFNNGDKAIICFWQGDGAGGATGEDRTGLKDRFAYIEIVHDGTTTYVIDVELKPKEAPGCNWYLPSTATINREKTAYSYANDDFTYSFDGTTHYHYRNYGSELIFDSVSSKELLDITFDFGEGDGYAETNKHTYTAIGDYTAHHKVINQYSLESICDKTIRLKYNVPIGCLTFSPDGIGANDIVVKGDTATVTACITDEDSRITNIDYKWLVNDKYDNSTSIKDELVASNTTLDYSYDKTIESLDETFSREIISWNDGWEDLTVTKTRELTITNINPEVSISKVDLSAKEKRFTQISSDADGSVTSWNWKIYLLMPFSGDWVEVYQTANDGSDIDIQFTEAGKYKMEITVEDDWKKFSTTSSTAYGTASAEIEFDISAAGTCTGTAGMNDEVFFIFPDVIGDGIE